MGKTRGMKWSLVIPPLLLLLLMPPLSPVVLPAMAGGLRGGDYIQVHSVFPPILQNFWQSGMRFWTFGLNTVVTDNYIRLTGNAPDATGYFWNRHLNRMEAFEMSVTVQMLNREAKRMYDVREGGMGIWYTTSEKFTNESDTQFFGFKRRFVGVGVIVTHSDEIILVTNDGSTDLETHAMGSHRHGGCHVSKLGELHITILLRSQANTIVVSYVQHVGEEPQPEEYNNPVECIKGPFPSTNDTYHFGVTATNSVASRAVHEIHSVIMTPLSDASLHKAEDEEAKQFHLFGAEEERGVRKKHAGSGNSADGGN